MEPPVTSIHRGCEAAVERSARAIVSGRTVNLADVPVLIRATDMGRAAAMARMLGRLDRHASVAQFSVAFDGQAPPIPGRSPDWSGPELDMWLEPHGATFYRHASGVACEVSHSVARIGGWADDLDIPFQRLFPLAVTHLLASRERFLLHAGAIAPPGKPAYLVLGGTGCGKSTLALAALTAGWLVLGDDLAVVRFGASGPDVCGVPRPPAVPADLLAGVPVQTLATETDARGRRQLSNACLHRGWLPVGGVLSAAHGTRPGAECNRAPGQPILHALVQAFGSAMDPAQLRRYFPHAAALSRLPNWNLAHGTDRRTRLDSASQVLIRIDQRPPGA